MSRRSIVFCAFAVLAAALFVRLGFWQLARLRAKVQRNAVIAAQQHEKARGKAKGQSQGEAVGLNESTPPGHDGQTGPPANSNAGGSSGSHGSGKAAPHTPNGTAQGHTKTPPGRSK